MEPLSFRSNFHVSSTSITQYRRKVITELRSYKVSSQSCELYFPSPTQLFLQISNHGSTAKSVISNPPKIGGIVDSEDGYQE